MNLGLSKYWSKRSKEVKIQKKIAHDFVNENKTNIDILIDILNQKDNDILIYMEAMANCELNLINELKEKVSKSNITNTENINDVNPIARIYNEFQLSLFMKKWSNQFVIGILIMISIISLTKQAWA